AREPGIHEHRLGHNRHLPVFMASGFAAARCPGMTKPGRCRALLRRLAQPHDLAAAPPAAAAEIIGGEDLGDLHRVHRRARTQVAVTAMSGSRILRVSTAIFHSSLVEPPSMNSAICGMTLNAICLVRCSGLIWSLT